MTDSLSLISPGGLLSFARTIEDFTEDPYSMYRAMQSEAPLSRVGPNDFVVTDPQLMLELFKDHSRFSSARCLEGQVPIAGAAREVLADTLFFGRALINEAPPEHTAFRRTFGRPFTSAAVADLEPRIRELTAEMCGDLSGRHGFDVFGELAFPLPIKVLSEVIGIPDEDRQRVKQWNDQWIALQVLQMPEKDQVRAALSVRAYEDYMRGLIEEITSARRACLLLDMVDAIDTPSAVHDVNDVIVAARMMIGAGHDVASGLIGNAVALLIETGRWEALARNPAAIPDFVEETLMLDPPLQSAPRLVEESTELHGITVPAGARVHLAIGAYSALEGKRGNGPHASRHIAFGYGVHHCVGAHLGRAQARIVLAHLLAAIPATPRFDEESPPIRMPGGYVFRSFSSLPLLW
ncbi:cytochrome P450 [Micromonospora sp. R77]|uniref:cytochrome P450 n=1 Tax=Micromonospora sp. R77 TaxID=2925836 RepID=UPI001F60FF73|nr:cytochrome P450 [Micromonospora sp. R77]MCI4061460.1 cytochrome P450 [Micromonospora sp. R77]